MDIPHEKRCEHCGLLKQNRVVRQNESTELGMEDAPYHATTRA